MVLLSLGRNNCLEVETGLQRRKSDVILLPGFLLGKEELAVRNFKYCMLSISVIIFFSVVLFAYWFRYSCLLILQNRVSYDQAYAIGSGLTFPVVQQRLRGEERSLDLLDQLRRDLSNDYRILCFL